MSEEGRYQAQSIPLQLSRGRIVASIQVELSNSVLDQFRSDLLEFVRDSHASGVVMDFSGLEMMDAAEFSELKRIMDMVRLMGSAVIVAGLRPGIVSSLIDLEANLDGLTAALDLDDAFEILSGRELDHQVAGPDDGAADLMGTPSDIDPEPPFNHTGDLDAVPDL